MSARQAVIWIPPPDMAIGGPGLGRRAEFVDLVQACPILLRLLDTLDAYPLPDAYVVAGVISQSIWNLKTGRPPHRHIKDADIVYFDGADLSAQAETAHEVALSSLLSDLPFKIDVKNEARVHIWYETRFGVPLSPYGSTAQAIGTFPTPVNSVGIRRRAGHIDVCAPFGLDDLLDMVLRPNKVQITEEVYVQKCARWSACWPELTVLAWDG